jgi:tRNA A-37 threonylcarbamoyl transferase component Bud32
VQGDAIDSVTANYHRDIEAIDLGIPGLTNVGRIGAGGNAIVYRARQADLDRDVVVKVLTNVDADTTRRRFDRERRAMGRLSQEVGIAPLYGSGFTPTGQPYLLMPFYEHGSLQDQLDGQGALGAERVRDIGVAVAAAVQTAHENGVLHRDLKPANILLRASGQPDVADFGIAHLTDDALGTSQALTMTPLYTAPEVFDGVESGAASDVYSVGATLFALLNGYPAHSDPGGTTPVLSLIRRINEDPLPELPATVPKDLAAAISRAMSKDPRERQATAGDLAAELAEADLASPVQRGARRSPLLVASLVALLLAAVAGAALAFMLIDRSDIASDLDAAVAAAPTSDTVEPTVTSTGQTAVPASFDLVAASAAAKQALVRIEAFSCTGAQVATGVMLNDGIIVTSERILASPWLIEVRAAGQVRRATAEISDTVDGLAFVQIDDARSFDVLTGARVAHGDHVAIVGIDGRPVLAMIVPNPDDASLLQAKVLNAGEGNAVEPLDIIVTDTGGLVGIARVTPGQIDVITPKLIQGDGDNIVSPSYDCLTLRRDLGPNDAESAVSPAIAELLTMQQLSDAYANEQWPLVRQLEPGKASLSDANFVNGWRPLRQGFVYPVDRSIDGGLARWRIGLIGHETWNGNDLTTLFCLTWTVDPVSGSVSQTNEDNVTVYGSQVGQELRPGFVDPSDLRKLIDQNCPL